MEKKLSTKQIIVIASTLFGLCFGAGNLIFPSHLGQAAGYNFAPATVGFVITAVGIPILGVISIGFSRSSGFFALSSKVSKGFGYFITILLYLAIGPFFCIPRNASVSCNSGFSAIFENLGWDVNVCYVIFTICFFIIVGVLSWKPSQITLTIGKIINPVFLILLGILLFVALFNPVGDIAQITPTEEYQAGPFFLGFKEGYQTMDALAGLAFGVIVIDSIKDMGVTKSGSITKTLLKAGIITAVVMAFIYLLIVVVGGESRGIFELSANGSTALTQISNHYFGAAGDITLGIIVTLACMKTSIGLVASCSATFNEMLPCKALNYKRWVFIFICVSLLIANIGLDSIISWATPVLSFLYPVAIVLILLPFGKKIYGDSKIVYRVTIIFTIVPAVFDALASLPADFVSVCNLEGLISVVSSIFPFADVGFGWVVPAIVGFVVGIIAHKIAIGKSNSIKED